MAASPNPTAPGPREATTNSWDSRWDADQRADAVALAEERLSLARADLERAARRLRDQAQWWGDVTYFKARADARETVPGEEGSTDAR